MTPAATTTRRRPLAVAILATVVLAVGLRAALFNQVSGDYTAFVDPWYRFISTRGGFAALRFNFSNYNPPYLYLLTIATAIPAPELVAVKMISVAFDLLLAVFVYLIVNLQAPDWRVPWACAAGALLAPSVVLNGAAWAQCDSIYASFCLASLYFLLREKPWWASTCFGIALSFKLQAVFFLPVVLIVFASARHRRGRSLASLMVVPLIFLIMLTPALIAGRSLVSMLDIYPEQVRTGGNAVSTIDLGQSSKAPQNPGPAAPADQQQPPGAHGPPVATPEGRDSREQSIPYTFIPPQSYTGNAANFYQWLGPNPSVVWKYLGFLLTALTLAALGIAAIRRVPPMSRTRIVLLAAAVGLAVPFLLPGMHERYFYLADALCIVAVGYRPKLWWVAILAMLCSLAAYSPFLWGMTVWKSGVVAAVELVVVAAMAAAFAYSPQVLKVPVFSMWRRRVMTAVSLPIRRK